MAIRLHCRSCRVELDRVPIAGGRVLVVCIGCEGWGLSTEVAHGARLGGFETRAVRARRAAAAARAAAANRSPRKARSR